MLTVYCGPARCGKSEHAEAQAARTELPVVYLATLPDTPRNQARIAAHRARRPASWDCRVVEHELLECLQPQALEVPSVLLLDGLAIHVLHRCELMLRFGHTGRAVTNCVFADTIRFVEDAACAGHELIVVTNPARVGGLAPPMRACLDQVNTRVQELAGELHIYGS